MTEAGAALGAAVSGAPPLTIPRPDNPGRSGRTSMWRTGVGDAVRYVIDGPDDRKGPDHEDREAGEADAV